MIQGTEGILKELKWGRSRKGSKKEETLEDPVGGDLQFPKDNWSSTLSSEKSFQEEWSELVEYVVSRGIRKGF